jgi:hypothetical protein
MRFTRQSMRGSAAGCEVAGRAVVFTGNSPTIQWKTLASCVDVGKNLRVFWLSRRFLPGHRGAHQNSAKRTMSVRFAKVHARLSDACSSLLAVRIIRPGRLWGAAAQILSCGTVLQGHAAGIKAQFSTAVDCHIKWHSDLMNWSR